MATMQHFFLALAAASLTFHSFSALAQSGGTLEEIQRIADASKCSKLREAPRGFFRGMALVFAKAVCRPESKIVQIASSMASTPISIKNSKDAASVFDAEFRRLKIANSPDKATMLRHTYLLLTGLAFRESSGHYCKGRYTSQGYSKSYEAEAGPFQTSWGAHKSDKSLEPLFRSYQSDQSGCLLGAFQERVTCKKMDAKNWNSEHARDLSGVQWQALTKRCPAFAVEYASVVLRKNGGAYGEFGPVKCFVGTQSPKIQRSCQKLRIYPVCDEMYAQIQTYLQKNVAACDNF
jgi:hypothetical protein